MAVDDSSSLYTGILSYGIGFLLFILVAVVVIIYRIKRPAKKAMSTTPIQKVSKFPLKRQVTESRYKILTPLIPSFHLCNFVSMPAGLFLMLAGSLEYFFFCPEYEEYGLVHNFC